MVESPRDGELEVAYSKKGGHLNLSLQGERVKFAFISEEKVASPSLCVCRRAPGRFSDMCGFESTHTQGVLDRCTRGEASRCTSVDCLTQVVEARTLFETKGRYGSPRSRQLWKDRKSSASGYPQAAWPWLMREKKLVRSRTLLARVVRSHSRATDSCTTSSLWREVPDDSLVLVDRDFRRRESWCPRSAYGHRNHVSLDDAGLEVPGHRSGPVLESRGALGDDLSQNC